MLFIFEGETTNLSLIVYYNPTPTFYVFILFLDLD